MAEPMTIVRSSLLVLPDSNIDTDQIIPARFLTTVSESGMGQHLFADRRDAPPLNDPRAAECAVLIAGENFGCGSSREHAAWALADFGIRVVVSTQIADIFRSNAMKNGILPICAEQAVCDALAARPWQDVEVDLPARRIRFDNQEFEFTVDAFGAHCLERGMDQLDYLVERQAAIQAYEEQR